MPADDGYLDPDAAARFVGIALDFLRFLVTLWA